MLISSVMSLHR